ncbi:MAG TPA: hypothetical protein VMR34_00270 [Candidatus Saccharimonadales bacterium]|nr:hypothetical protein [Candidatus Saccharimonadales bacterium]
MDNRYRSGIITVKIDDSVFVEVETDTNVQPLIAEVLRWRSVIGTVYSQQALTTYKV